MSDTAGHASRVPSIDAAMTARETRALRRWPWLVGGVAFLIAAAFVMAGSIKRSPGAFTAVELPAGVGIEPRFGGGVPDDLVFRDEQGRDVALGELVRDKPVILNLAYYECPMLCSMVLDGLVRSLRALSFDAGDEFQVVTVSFDHREGPELAAAAKRTAMKRYGREGAAAGWHFLTGDEAAIRRLCDAVGFHFAYDARTDQFGHGAGVFVLTPAGKVSRFFSGVEFPARDLRLGLIEAADEQIGTAGDRVLLLCYHYDPSRGAYGLAILNLIRLAGLATVAGMVVGFWSLKRWERTGVGSAPRTEFG